MVTEPAGPPFKATLWIKPAFRTDFIDVRAKLAEEFGSEFARYPKALYISDHTTAGYLDQRLAQRLEYDQAKLQEFIRVFHEIFPPKAGYVHDELDLRTELSDEQRATEPENADSHLTFIGAGLQSAASYDHEKDKPVWFVDLDGVHRGGTRQRRTTVVGYGEEEVVARTQLTVQVPSHGIDAIDLREQEFGFVDRLQALVEEHGVPFGRLDVSLAPQEAGASLTVNEYEPLLMNSDLRGVLLSPLRFMADQGREVLNRPLSLPGKALRLPGKALRLSGKALRLSGKALSVAKAGHDRVAELSGTGHRFRHGGGGPHPEPGPGTDRGRRIGDRTRPEPDAGAPCVPLPGTAAGDQPARDRPGRRREGRDPVGHVSEPDPHPVEGPAGADARAGRETGALRLIAGPPPTAYRVRPSDQRSPLRAVHGEARPRNQTGPLRGQERHYVRDLVSAPEPPQGQVRLDELSHPLGVRLHSPVPASARELDGAGGDAVHADAVLSRVPGP